MESTDHSISFFCGFNNIREFPSAMKNNEKLMKYGENDNKVIYAFQTLIYDIPLDDKHCSNNTPKTLFTIIAANNTGLKNMYKLVSVVNTREKIILDPTEVKTNSEGLLFAKEIVDPKSKKSSWEVRMGSIDSGEPIEILSDFSYDELSKIEHLIGEVNMVSQTWGSCGAYWPRVTDADKDLINDCYTKAHSIYGDILPSAVEDRLSKELDAITRNGFAIIYSIAQKIVKRAESEGIQVSCRGGVASSLFINICALNVALISVL